MKTTIELPDELFVAAKKRAAELRQPLRQLIEDGVRKQLAEGGLERNSRRRKIKWVTLEGGIPPGMDVANRQSMVDYLQRSM